MKLLEMIKRLRMKHRVELRTSEGYEICVCDSDSVGIEPYLNWTVVQWFAYDNPIIRQKANIAVYIEREENE